MKEIINENKKLKQLVNELRSKKEYGLVWEKFEEENEYIDYNFFRDKEKDISIKEEEGGLKHKIIEGDNLLALRKLEKSYTGKIDVIYIDPPYNTGNEFVYSDKFKGKEGYLHSKWLSFMAKRLEIAKRLLTENGVIFVSIDDNEQAQLKLLMDKIFGERNFISNILWEKTRKPSGNTSVSKRTIDTKHEYIYVYAKEKENINFDLNYDSNEELKRKGYKLKDEYFKERGYYKLTPLWRSNSGSSFRYNKSLDYPVTAPNGETITIWRNKKLPPNRQMCYTWSKETFNIGNKLGFIECRQDSKGRWSVYRKIYSRVKFDPKEREVVLEKRGTPYTDYYNGATTDTSAKLLNELGIEFNFSKPVELIKHLLKIVGSKEITVLDFFAGSGTTGQAVMELNEEDKGERQFILCTNNEVSNEKVRFYFYKQGAIPKLNKTEFNRFKEENPEIVADFMKSNEYQELGIARSVTQPRIKKVIEGYTTPKGEEVEGLTGNKVEYYKITPSKKGEVNE